MLANFSVIPGGFIFYTWGTFWIYICILKYPLILLKPCRQHHCFHCLKRRCFFTKSSSKRNNMNRSLSIRCFHFIFGEDFLNIIWIWRLLLPYITFLHLHEMLYMQSFVISFVRHYQIVAMKVYAVENHANVT